MVFQGSKKILFDNAYQAYRDINDYLSKTFFDEYGNPTISSGIDLKFDIVKMYTEIYIQMKLYEIAFSDGKISENEKHFIVSIVDDIDYIKRSVPNYRQFVANFSESIYKQFVEEETYNPNGIPDVVRMSVDNDLKQNTFKTYDVINNFEIIFSAIVELENLEISKEKKMSIDEIERLKKYSKDRGVRIQAADALSDSDDPNDTEKIQADVLSELLNELDSLTGLASVKEDVNSTINFLKINAMRKENGMPSIPVSNHMVFLGNPGTGKTTVARLLAKIYKELGVVSKGQLIETDRAGLVAGYVGQTALKTTEVVRRAIGGILFIDEAYSLASSDSSNDFGTEAIDTLVKLMEDNRDNLVVIVAGYNDEMHKFIDSNPGLSSRFNRYFTFDDYSCSELIEIFKNICRKNGFVVSESAIKKLRQVIDSTLDIGKFGNARGIRNIFDKAVLNQANRLMKNKNISKADLSTIIESDLSFSSYNAIDEVKKTEIGFSNVN